MPENDKSLPSPPADSEQGAPKVGERWLAYHSNGNQGACEITEVRSVGCPYTVQFEDGGRWGCLGPGERKNGNRQLIRRLPPAETGWVLKVGDEVEGEWLGPDRRLVRGRIIELDVLSGVLCARGHVVDSDGQSMTLDPSTIRPATQPEANAEPIRADGKVMCADCGKEIANPLEACARTRLNGERYERVPGVFHAKCGPTGPADPYAAHRSRTDRQRGGDIGVAKIMLEKDRTPGTISPRAPNAHDLRVAALKAQHLADFDRKVKPRHPSDWDVDDTDELRVT